VCLEEKANSGLNTLLEKLSSRATVIDVDDAPPDVVALEQLEERWETEKDSVRAALAILTNEPVPQSFYRPARAAIVTFRSVTRLADFARAAIPASARSGALPLP
jgi:hypothetical protein